MIGADVTGDVILATDESSTDLAAISAARLGGRAIALRYHNVYGPRMPRDTPYAGVAALFRSALESTYRPISKLFPVVSTTARAAEMSAREDRTSPARAKQCRTPASAGAWPEAVRIAAEGAIPLRKLISETFKAEDFGAAVKSARHSRTSVKTLLKWE